MPMEPQPVVEADEDLTARPSARMEVLVAVLALVASAGVIYLARTLELRVELGSLGPRWWPTLLGIGGVLLSALLVTMAFSKGAQSRGDLLAGTPEGVRRVAAVLAVTVLYVVAWQLVGYAPATWLMLLATMWLSGARGVKGLVLFPLITTAFIVVLFSSILRVPL